MAVTRLDNTPIRQRTPQRKTIIDAILYKMECGHALNYVFKEGVENIVTFMIVKHTTAGTVPNVRYVVHRASEYAEVKELAHGLELAPDERLLNIVACDKNTPEDHARALAEITEHDMLERYDPHHFHKVVDVHKRGGGIPHYRWAMLFEKQLPHDQHFFAIETLASPDIGRDFLIALKQLDDKQLLQFVKQCIIRPWKLISKGGGRVWVAGHAMGFSIFPHDLHRNKTDHNQDGLFIVNYRDKKFTLYSTLGKFYIDHASVIYMDNLDRVLSRLDNHKELLLLLQLIHGDVDNVTSKAVIDLSSTP